MILNDSSELLEAIAYKYKRECENSQVIVLNFERDYFKNEILNETEKEIDVAINSVLQNAN